MLKILESSIRDLRGRADLVAAVERCVKLKKAGAAWVGLCPFHEEKSGSFHVRPGKGFKCFGCGKGGDVFAFVMATEGLGFVAAVVAVAERNFFALEYEPAPQGTRSAESVSGADGRAVVALPAGCDEATARRAIKRQMRYQAEREAEARVGEAWRDAWRARVEAKEIRPWSDLVSGRFEAGGATAERVARVAVARGWPERWAWWLVEEGLMRFPLPPWADRERAEIADEVAFRVDKPAMVKRAGGWEVAGVTAVGYHQRFLFKEKKMWRFVPYFPAAVDAEGKEVRLTDFKRALRAECAARELVEGGSVLPPLPFVMGNPVGVRFLIFAEGQWDAVTVAGACGWLESDTSWPEGVVVMGARGSTSVEVLLAYWGAWLERERPAVLVLSDNDAAGRKWDEVPATVLGEVPAPNFAQRLLRRPGWRDGEAEWVPLARRAEVARVNPVHGKDLNDFWKARRPSAVAMAEWLRGMGFCDDAGRWL